MWLSQYFPSLHPTLCNETEHSISMKGDVVEICMAALRGHPDFSDAVLSFSVPLPTLFDNMNQLSRTVQYIDAFLRTGRLKFQDVRVQRLPLLLPYVRYHPFVINWMQDDTRHLALCSLVWTQHLRPQVGNAELGAGAQKPGAAASASAGASSLVHVEQRSSSWPPLAPRRREITTDDLRPWQMYDGRFDSCALGEDGAAR